MPNASCASVTLGCTQSGSTKTCPGEQTGTGTSSSRRSLNPWNRQAFMVQPRLRRDLHRRKRSEQRKMATGRSLLSLFPPVQSLPLAECRIDEGAVRFVAGVDPDHRHRFVRAVEETVGTAFRNTGRVEVCEFVFPAGDLAGRGSVHDGDRLIKSVEVAGQ